MGPTQKWRSGQAWGWGARERSLHLCLYCSLWVSGRVHTHVHSPTLATLVQLPRAFCKHRTSPSRTAHHAPTRPDPSPDFVACLKDSHCCPGSGLCHQAPRHPSKSHPCSRAAAGGRDPAHGPPTPQGASPTLTQVAHTNPSTVSGAFVPLVPPLPQQDHRMPAEARSALSPHPLGH